MVEEVPVERDHRVVRVEQGCIVGALRSAGRAAPASPGKLSQHGNAQRRAAHRKTGGGAPRAFDDIGFAQGILDLPSRVQSQPCAPAMVSD